jgi:hypothetical protein
MQPRPEQQRVALCLSGGGLRATLFHLGVVRALRDVDVLRSVTDVFSVSGGSILAAHMVLHWRDYAESGPDDTRFLNRSGALGELGHRDIRGRIIRRAVLLGWLPRFGRTALLVVEDKAQDDTADDRTSHESREKSPGVVSAHRGSPPLPNRRTRQPAPRS